MEWNMSDKYQSAAHRLHRFVSDDADLTDAEIKECLKAEGVDVGRFLLRLGKASGRAAKVPTAAERLRELANRAGTRVKKLLGEGSTVAQIPTPSVAYGRKGKNSGRSKKSAPSAKRTK
jgi:hypothetical protein